MKRKTAFPLLILSVFLLLFPLSSCFQKKSSNSPLGADTSFTIFIEPACDISLYGLRCEYYQNRTPVGGMEYGSPHFDETLPAHEPIRLALPALLFEKNEIPTFGFALTLYLEQSEVLLPFLTEWNAQKGVQYSFVLSGNPQDGFSLTPQNILPAFKKTSWSDLPAELLPPGESPFLRKNQTIS